MSIVVGTTADRAAAMLLSGVSSDELDRRDALQRPIGRWFAYNEGVAVGVATAFVRPDGRTFVVPRVASEAAFAPLLERALDELDTTLYLTVDRESPRVDVMLSHGLEIELESVSFEVPFAMAIEQARQLRAASRVTIMRADQVDREALFDLDVALRQDVPGTEGWRGNQEWFEAEFGSPQFDASGYLVAVDPATRQLVGLVRFWRDDLSPSLGLLGVRREWRSGRSAIALISAGLTAASSWGSDTFRTHTAHPSIQRRIRRVGGTPSGSFVRLRST